MYLNSLKGPASHKTWKPLQSLRKEREGGDGRAQVAAEDQRVSLILNPGRLGRFQPHRWEVSFPDALLSI